VRACTSHTSPGAGQPLCKDLWTHWGNAQATHCIAVDARGCGKVDNRTAEFEPHLRAPLIWVR